MSTKILAKNPSEQDPKEDNVYPSTDRLMVWTLMLLKHRPVRLEIDKDGQIVYVFKKDEVDENVQRFLTADTSLCFGLPELFWVDSIWQANLRNLSQHRAAKH